MEQNTGIAGNKHPVFSGFYVVLAYSAKSRDFLFSDGL